MGDIIVRPDGWKTMDPETIQETHAMVQTLLAQQTPQHIIHLGEALSTVTHAEAFGCLVREKFQCYQVILDQMRPSRTWRVLKASSTYHSRSHDLDAILLRTQEDEQEVQGYFFDPMVFDFKWVDNTLEHPWKPWGWKIDFFADDIDDNHYFLEPATNRLIACEGSAIDDLRFYGMSPQLPTGLTRFCPC